MLHFFRRIRQRLLTENRFTKYLLYAIGEILLVVIGILIALQVNNWNESRIDHLKETKILMDLRDDLLETEDQFLQHLNFYDEVIQHRKAIIKTIEENLIWDDTLQDHLNNFWWYKPLHITSTTYATLQDWGVSNIKNESLRREIIYIFENQVDQCDVANESHSNVHWEASWQKDLRAIYDLSDFTHIRIRDYAQFLDSDDYANREKVFVGTFNFLNVWRKDILMEIIRVRKSIETELETR
jgi:hypothetical protein